MRLYLFYKEKHEAEYYGTPGKLAQWLMFFAFKDGILYRRVGINQEDAWETASGAANSEAFLVIPGTLNASRMT